MENENDKELLVPLNQGLKVKDQKFGNDQQFRYSPCKGRIPLQMDQSRGSRLSGHKKCYW